MKVFMENDKVVCSLDDKNKQFLRDCYLIFDGFQNGHLKMRESGIETDYKRLKAIVTNAYIDGVEVSDEVTERLNTLKAQAEEAYMNRRREEERRKRQSTYEYKCKNGCDCKQMEAIDWESDGYIYRCKATGKVLEKKNIPTYGPDGVYYLFNWVSVPSEDCPYNAKEAEK